ncbi:MAG: integrase arm-type DNA-binding domain-containing protein [Gallionellaceae bacterium]|nr:integrase arm-type DNA-binding domain-containing protein [Gallionellaceae bacterium]
MGKRAIELSALEVSRLAKPGLHFVGVVAGLALQVTATGARSWIMRIRIAGKRRDMGLGGYPDVTLAGAREKARQIRDMADQGIDPILERRLKKSALAAELAKSITFSQAAEQFIKDKSPEWKNAKHAAQWSATLEQYAYPVIGKMHVMDIELPHILNILRPIWTTKTETASRLRGRIDNVLDWATVQGYRTGPSPARWKGHLDKLLAAPAKTAKVEHHAAMPYQQINGFLAALGGMEGIAARAVEFAILTAARSGEVRGATWAEIDLQAGVWTIPEERMKAGKEHRIPLSDRALSLLIALPRLADTETVFFSPRGGVLSDMSLTAVMRRMEIDATVHGFRSSFRDWAGETTAYPREVIEHALAHQLKDKAEAAYARGTLFDKRRRLMDDWAKFCGTVQATAGKVLVMRKGGQHG